MTRRRGWARWLCAAAALCGAAVGPARAQDLCPPTMQPPSAAEQQAAAATARDRGFLWRLSKDGRSSHLYGTIHLGRPDWLHPGPRVRAALAASDTLALEIDLTDPAVMQSLAPDPYAVAPALPAPLQARIARQIAAACLPAVAIATQHPVMQAVTLTVLAARWDGLDPGYAQEFVLAGQARRRGLPIVSLESVELQRQALIPPDPAQVQPMVEQMLEQLEQGRARRVVVRMAQAWERGDLAELEAYAQWCDCVHDEHDRAFMKRLNDDRNPRLAERIDALHRDGQRVFAAVGALHMTGPMGLPGLLAQRGYRVERVDLAP